jgi:hypothetical protein
MTTVPAIASSFSTSMASCCSLYFFNPILTSLRGIQQASALRKV